MCNFTNVLVKGRCMKLSWSGLMLLASLQVANADVGKTDRYALPPSKVHLETCQHEALRLHRGLIDELRVLPQQKSFWIRYEIQMRGGAEWSVVCDLANGKIIRDQSLDVAVSQ
jgi:hypothetical protein